MTKESNKFSFSTILVEKRGNGLIVLTLNRPEAGNAVNTEMGTELLDFWTDLVRNHEGLRMDVRSALRYEVEAYNRLTATEDRVEGTLAWNEKRKPIFKGR